MAKEYDIKLYRLNDICDDRDGCTQNARRGYKPKYWNITNILTVVNHSW